VENLARLVMVLENVIIVPVPGIPEKKANAQNVMELENVPIVEVRENWLQEYGLLNNSNVSLEKSGMQQTLPVLKTML
jgi:hypothetical protein